MSVLISLVGEQPIPNLMAIRAEQPDAVVLVWSAFTKGVARRLSDLPKMPEIIDCPVNAYDFDSIRDGIDAAIAKRGWVRDEITFNLTGGTKTMAFAAYELAKSMRLPFTYLQSEGNTSQLFRYVWEPDPSDSAMIVPHKKDAVDVSGLIELDEYIRAHVGKWWYASSNGDERGRRFEALVREALLEQGVVDELRAGVSWMGGAEADLIMRLGGNFGVAEIKINLRGNRPIEQLGLITRQRVFGTYIRKLLIGGREMDYNSRQVAESTGIQVIELTSWQQGDSLTGPDLAAFQLSSTDKSQLQQMVRQAMMAEGDAA